MCSTLRFGTSICRYGAFKPQFDQIRFVDKDVDYAHRIGLRDVIVEALGK